MLISFLLLFQQRYTPEAYLVQAYGVPKVIVFNIKMFTIKWRSNTYSDLLTSM